MFCCPLTDHLMPADASAPLNKRTAPSSNSFSLCYLFRKNEILLSPMFCFVSSYPPIFFHAWSPNYCGVVALAVFFLSCCCSSFEVFHIIIVVERWRRWCECWCCRLPDCHPTSSLQGSKARALFTDGKRFWKKLMQGTVNTTIKMLLHIWRLQTAKDGRGGYQKAVVVRSIIREVACKVMGVQDSNILWR